MPCMHGGVWVSLRMEVDPFVHCVVLQLRTAHVHLNKSSKPHTFTLQSESVACFSLVLMYIDICGMQKGGAVVVGDG